MFVNAQIQTDVSQKKYIFIRFKQMQCFHAPTVGYVVTILKSKHTYIKMQFLYALTLTYVDKCKNIYDSMKCYMLVID